MRPWVLSVVVSLPLFACQGPSEKAGESRDKAVAASTGEPYKSDGPNQRMGRAQDKADASAKAARAAEAKALEQQGEKLRTQADIAADRLEGQAKSIRENAGVKVEQISDQANSVRR